MSFLRIFNFLAYGCKQAVHFSASTIQETFISWPLATPTFSYMSTTARLQIILLLKHFFNFLAWTCKQIAQVIFISWSLTNPSFSYFSIPARLYIILFSTHLPFFQPSLPFPASNIVNPPQPTKPPDRESITQYPNVSIRAGGVQGRERGRLQKLIQWRRVTGGRRGREVGGEEYVLGHWDHLRGRMEGHRRRKDTWSHKCKDRWLDGWMERDSSFSFLRFPSLFLFFHFFVSLPIFSSFSFPFPSFYRVCWMEGWMEG